MNKKDHIAEIKELRGRLEEAEATLDAIRTGGVDALVVAGPEGDRVYTLEGADYPYRVLVEMMSEGVVTLSSDGTILSCNTRFIKLARKPAEKIIGRPLVEFAADWDRQKLEKFLETSSETGGVTTITLEAERHLHTPVNVSLGVLEVGGPTAYCAVVTDLTESLSASELKATLASIVESSNDAIFSRSLDGVIQTWNEAAERIFGYKAGEIVGKHVSALAPAENAPELLELEQKACRGELMKEHESVALRKDGAWIQISLTLSPLRDAHGKINGISTIVRDITDRKKIESELALHQEHLEELVEMRTKELSQANEKLRRITGDLQRSNRDLEQFAYIASHDLQEPLRQIVAFTQFLDERYRDKLDEQARELMDFIVSGGHRMQALIQDLLAFSRVGKGEKQLEPTDLDQLFEELLNNLKYRIEQAGATVTHDHLPTVMADDSQMIQLFQNLLLNALKFRGDSPPEIKVSAQEDGDVWLFSVKDNGIGFEQRFTDKIFNLFQRLHSHKNFPGTGIGLPICKRIVERHGGKIWAESKPGEGATFYFTIPAEMTDPNNAP